MVTKDGVTDLDECNIYKNFSSVSNETEPCPLGWYYDTEVPGNTIVSEVITLIFSVMKLKGKCQMYL